LKSLFLGDCHVNNPHDSKGHRTRVLGKNLDGVLIRVLYGFRPDHRVQLVDGAADTIRAAGLKTATRVGKSKVVADALMP
jgi:hypothetical protein